MSKVIIDSPELRIIEIPPMLRTIRYDSKNIALSFPRLCLVSNSGHLGVFVTEFPIDPSATYIDLFPLRINNSHPDGELCLQSGDFYNAPPDFNLFFHTEFTPDLTNDLRRFHVPIPFGKRRVARDFSSWAELSSRDRRLGEAFNFSKFAHNLITYPFDRGGSPTICCRIYLDPTRGRKYFYLMRPLDVFSFDFIECDMIPDLYYDPRIAPYMEQFQLIIDLYSRSDVAFGIHFEKGYSLDSISTDNPIWDVFRELSQTAVRFERPLSVTTAGLLDRLSGLGITNLS